MVIGRIRATPAVTMSIQIAHCDRTAMIVWVGRATRVLRVHVHLADPRRLICGGRDQLAEAQLGHALF